MTALKATSNTISGSTVRRNPWSSIVCSRNHSRHLRDLDVGESRVGLAYIQQFIVGFARTNSEGVIAEDCGSFAVSELYGGDYHVQGCKFTFQLQPRFAAAPGA